MKCVEINLCLFLKSKIYATSPVEYSKHINAHILPTHFPEVEKAGIYFPVATQKRMQETHLLPPPKLQCTLDSFAPLNPEF